MFAHGKHPNTVCPIWAYIYQINFETVSAAIRLMLMGAISGSINPMALNY